MVLKKGIEKQCTRVEWSWKTSLKTIIVKLH
jgi:hypothetical protein